MEEEPNQADSCQFRDQLHHILNFKSSTYCLVCKTIVVKNSSPIHRKNCISKHLCASDHLKHVRSLFKVCNPDPFCHSLNERCIDIVTKSVFDISVLLENDPSYICQKREHLLCLICKSTIVQVTSSVAVVEDKIIQHLESSLHLDNVKDVCWFYRLGTKDHYVLFHKSVVHCSVCSETLQCRETLLLQTVVHHLQSEKHSLNFQQNSGWTKHQSIKEEFSKFSETCRDYIDVNFPKIMKFKENITLKTEKINFSDSLNPVDNGNESQIELHHENHQMEINNAANGSFECNEDIISDPTIHGFSSENSEIHQLGYNLRPRKDQKCKFDLSILSQMHHVIERNIHFVGVRKNRIRCTLCNKIIGEIPDLKSVMNNCLSHFKGKGHAEQVFTGSGSNNSKGHLKKKRRLIEMMCRTNKTKNRNNRKNNKKTHKTTKTNKIQEKKKKNVSKHKGKNIKFVKTEIV